MNLPRGYRAKNFVLDPSGRINHLHHPKTDEVFHVDADTYAAVAKLIQPDTEEDDNLERAEVDLEAETGMTLAVEKDLEDVEGADEVGEPLTHDLEELKTMATALGLELAEDATPEDIQAAVHAAVGGAK